MSKTVTRIIPRYDPDLVRAIYDPDPDPFPWVILLVVAGVALWTNPDVVNNIMFILNPELAKIAREKQEAQLKTIMWVVALVTGICGLWMLIWWWERRQRTKLRNMARRRLRI